MRLKELRKLKGASQQKIADDLGLERTIYARYESGKRVPPLDKLVLLADYFGVTIDYLVGRTTQPSLYRHDAPDGKSYSLTTKKEPPTPEEREQIRKAVKNPVGTIKLSGDIEKDVLEVMRRIQEIEDRLRTEAQKDSR